jgi:hypothetical protein
MVLSLNCLILGQNTSEIFNILVDEISTINGVNIKFEDLTVANFKNDLFSKNELQGITKMNIWKVELEFNDIKSFSTEDDIKNHVNSEKMDDNPMSYFNEYYDNKDKKPKIEWLHIFIVPITTGKCTLIFYLSNKKFAVTKYRFDLISFFFALKQVSLSKAFHEVQYLNNYWPGMVSKNFLTDLLLIIGFRT